VTDPTQPGVPDDLGEPVTPVAADVTAAEPVAPAPAEPPVEAPVEPVAEEPAEVPAGSAEPEPAEPEPAPAPEVPAEPEAVPEVPAEPIVPAEPVTPIAPEPVPAPPAEPPAPLEPPEPPAPENVTFEAGLTNAAATTTEIAPPPAVPVADTPAPAETPVTEDTATADGTDDTEDAPGRRGGLLVGLTAAVALLALVALAFTVVGPLADARKTERLDDRREQALTQARTLALNLVSIDYKTLDRDLQRISESTTGKARADFDDKILKNDSYKQLVKDNEAVITSTIQRIGLEPCGKDDDACLRGDTANVLVFLDQESKNKLRPTPRVDRNRVLLTLVRKNDTWLVSDVRVL
jgi:hypothetical protein